MRRTTERLRLDGALDEAAWATADSITDFTQRDPAEGRPVSERTVARFLAAPDGLWAGVWAYDREPAGIRHGQLRYDAEFDTDDAVTLMLSPMEDRRTAFLFSVRTQRTRGSVAPRSPSVRAQIRTHDAAEHLTSTSQPVVDQRGAGRNRTGE